MPGNWENRAMSEFYIREAVENARKKADTAEICMFRQFDTLDFSTKLYPLYLTILGEKVLQTTREESNVENAKVIDTKSVPATALGFH